MDRMTPPPSRRRALMATLFAAQVSASTGFTMSLAVGSIMAAAITGSNTWSGLPVALGALGGALASWPLARLMGRVGRRPGLALGYAIAVVGAGLGMLAVVHQSFALFLVGMALFGTANTSNLLARYAAADISVGPQRGRAMGLIVWGSTVGSIIGPNLMDPAVRVGATVGVAAVAGNGQSELAEVITGLRACTGHVTVDGTAVGGRSPHVANEAGVSHVPEDRTGVGSAPNLSMVDNLILRRFRSAPLSHGPFMDGGAARTKAEELRGAYAISAPTIDSPARILSGGNLQRLILAREIDAAPTLLVAVQPTRGLDVGAIEGVHQLLLGLRERGTATLLVSEELEELLALADRVIVMYEGRIAGTFEAPGPDDIDQIGLLMTGGDEPSGVAHVALAPSVAPADPGATEPGA